MTMRRARSPVAPNNTNTVGPGSSVAITGTLLAPLVPAVEGGVVAGVPRRAQPGRAEIPVRAALAHRRTQVAPEIVDRRPPPEPVAVVDAVHDQSRLEHQGVRDHRIVVRVGVLLDVQVLLDRATRIRQERPL